MKKLLVMTCLLAARLASAQDAETKTLLLSGRGNDDGVMWDFLCSTGRNAGVWTNIAVPSCWEQQGFGAYGYQADPLKESGRYRRSFTVPAGWTDRTVRVVFEGVMTDAEVAINGRSAGPKHHGAFYPFKHDITKLLDFGGSNLIEVAVDKFSENDSINDAERRGDYWNFGGIFRPVYLEAVPRERIERVAVDAKADGSFALDVYFVHQLRTADRLVATVEGFDAPLSAPVATATPSAGGELKLTLRHRFDAQKNWTAETPHLYTVRLALESEGRVVHTISQRFGFRTVEVRAGDGIYVNNQRVVLKGACRHSFWPESGRTLNEKISRDDVALLKDLHANAVRMSHYPPDAAFLEACDELGLYVLDELAGWQHCYDTTTGVRLVEAMVQRDVNHPSIVLWDNGNEGGWNTEVDGEFAKWDPQQRAVLHPWAMHGGVQTAHYRPFAEVQAACASTNLYMPTEFLHGLYDGGAGAGLEDYWNVLSRGPVGSGGFLWALVDEGVVRTDLDGVIDAEKNRGPDGIVGPHREREGSFHTIREIWSPVQIAAAELTKDFDGRLEVENRHDFTDLSACGFTWKYVKLPAPSDRTADLKVLRSGVRPGPALAPHARGTLEIGAASTAPDADALLLTATDPRGGEIWTWSWKLRPFAEIAPGFARSAGGPMEAKFDGPLLRVSMEQTDLRFDPRDGRLASVSIDGRPLSFSGGAQLIAGGTTSEEVTENGKKKRKTKAVDLAGVNKLVSFTHDVGSDGIRVDATYTGALRKVSWMLKPGGWLRFAYEYNLSGTVQAAGMNFDFPEAKVKSVRWLGEGPHRVWKNRMKGPVLGVWTNAFNDTKPGETWVYPEFKGYFGPWNWAEFETTEGRITFLNESERTFLGVYRPRDGRLPMGTELFVPDTGLAILDAIPAIGNKFMGPEKCGPQSQPTRLSGTQSGAVWILLEPPSALPPTDTAGPAARTDAPDARPGAVPLSDAQRRAAATGAAAVATAVAVVPQPGPAGPVESPAVPAVAPAPVKVLPTSDLPAAEATVTTARPPAVREGAVTSAVPPSPAPVAGRRSAVVWVAVLLVGAAILVILAWLRRSKSG